MTNLIPDASYLSKKYDVNIDDDGNNTLSPEKQQQIIDEEYIASRSKVEQELSGRIENLVTALDSKNRELEKFAVLIESSSIVPGVDVEKYSKIIDGDEKFPDPRDHKIVSLAKKCRNLSNTLQKERRDRINAQKAKLDVEHMYERLQDKMENQTNSISNTRRNNNSNSIKNSNNSNENENYEIEVQTLRKNMATLQKQNDSLRHQQGLLQDNMKKMKRMVAKEVGDDTIIDKTLSNVDSGWRGRAQQIVMLKSKVKTLENELKNVRDKERDAFDVGESKGIDGDDWTMGGNSSTISNYIGGGSMNRNERKLDVDDMAVGSINNMVQERTKAVESIVAQNNELSTQNSQLRHKNKAQAARVKVLEREMNDFRDNVKGMVEKADEDHQLIDLLRQEIARLREKLRKSQQQQQSNMTSSPTRGGGGGPGTIIHKNANSLTNSYNFQNTDANSTMSLADERSLKRIIEQHSQQIKLQEDIIRQLRAEKSELARQQGY